MANKIIHKHSSVITDDKAKLPLASQLEYGELAINYAEGVETISMKNSANEIIEFKSKEYFDKIIVENEYVTASALLNLDTRLKTIENGSLDLDDTYVSKETFEEFTTTNTNAIKALNDSISNLDNAYASKETFEEFTTTNASTINTLVNSINEINTHIEENELVTTAALTDLDYRIKTIEDNNDGLGEKYTSKTDFDDYVATSSDAIKALDTLITESNERFDSIIIENEYVTASALTNINNRLKNVENSIDGGLGDVDLTIYATNESVDTKLSNLVDSAPTTLDTLGELATALKNNKDIVTVLESSIASKQNIISDIETIRSNASKGATAVQPTSLAAIATTGSYNDLINKPAIPSEVTEATVSGWGFTKNTGTYSKPGSGIPKTDLSSDIQTSLGKADTALQTIPDEYITNTELTAKGYITANEVNNKIDDCVNKTDYNAKISSIEDKIISSVDGLASEEYVDTKFNEVFQNVSNGKFLIASAITDKGIYASDDETFQELSDKIDLIKVAPPGTNIVGYVDEQNDIYLSLSDLENGTYDLRYEDYNGILTDFYDIGTVEVKE